MPSDLKQFLSTFLFRREPRATLSGVDNIGDVWHRPLPADCRRSFYLHPSQIQRRRQRAGQSRRTVQDVKHRRDDNHKRLQRWRYFGDWRRYWLNYSFADVNECKHNPEWCKTMFRWLMLTMSTGVGLLIKSLFGLPMAYSEFPSQNYNSYTPSPSPYGNLGPSNISHTSSTLLMPQSSSISSSCTAPPSLMSGSINPSMIMPSSIAATGFGKHSSTLSRCNSLSLVSR